MKTGIIFSAVAISLTCLTLTSCDLFAKKKTEQQKPELTGKWIFVNITDSSKDSANNIDFLLLAKALKDSTALTVEFKPDSSFITLKGDTSKYYIDSVTQTLFIRENSTTTPLTIKKQTDSTLELFSSTDSVWYTLQKDK